MRTFGRWTSDGDRPRSAQHGATSCELTAVASKLRVRGDLGTLVARTCALPILFAQ
jgi:hypothetical protein